MNLAVRTFILRLWLIIAGGAMSHQAVSAQSEGVMRQETHELREEVRTMFYHAYNNYMEHAFPLDELRPLSCAGEDSLGGYSLTLIDAMDTLALLGDVKEFSKAVRWVANNVNFDKNQTVSLFETNIRVMGGLLSAHLLASDPSTGMAVDGYKGKLLELAEDLGRRMLPAFLTPTGIPFGSVNLQTGVPPEETTVTSTAGGGTLALEFGLLSRLTGDPVFEELALTSLRGLWSRRSRLGLVGAHIDVFSGEWTHRDAGIGTSVDSFYEYLLKAHLLLGDDEYLHMFSEAYKAALQHLHQPPWYLEVNMDDGMVVWPLFNSLQAFWPGLQVLAGDVEKGAQTHAAFYGVWRRFGFTPEGFNLVTQDVQPGQKSYPLRPELAESTYWLYRATRDPLYLHVGRDIVASIQYGATCPCGYCHITDVQSHEKEDHMESFFLSETVKYLWLLFDSALDGDNLVENGPYPYVFSTEGHLFPIRPDLSLTPEQCTYLGSHCPKPGPDGQENPAPFRTDGQQKGAPPQSQKNDKQEEGGSLPPKKRTDSSPEVQPEGREKQASPQSIQDSQSFAPGGGAVCSPSERADDPLGEEKGLATAGVEPQEGAAKARKRFRLSDGKVSVDGRASEGVAEGTDGRPEGTSGVNELASEFVAEGEYGRAESASDVNGLASGWVAEGEDSRTESASGVNGLASEGVTEEEGARPEGASGVNGLLSGGVAEGEDSRVESAFGVDGIQSERIAEEKEDDGKLEDDGKSDAKKLPSVRLGEEVEEDRRCGDDVSSGEAAALGGAAAGAGSLDDVIEDVMVTSERDEAEWEEWTDDGARPFGGRCPALSFWRQVGVHNMIPFPPSADVVTNHEHIQARHRQRQLQQMQMAKFFQQGARAGNIVRVPAGQRFTVTIDHQGQLLFQNVESPPETPKLSPIRTSAALTPPESLSAEPPTCKA